MKLPLDRRTLVRAASPGALDLFSMRTSLLVRAADAVRAVTSRPRLPVREARRPHETRIAPSAPPPPPD